MHGESYGASRFRSNRMCSNRRLQGAVLALFVTWPQTRFRSATSVESETEELQASWGYYLPALRGTSLQIDTSYRKRRIHMN
jgi:hypothetical protein